MKRSNGLVAAAVLSSLLLLTLFVPNAQRAIDTIFLPLRTLTYPRASSEQQLASNDQPQASDDVLRVVGYGPNIGRREIIVDIQDQDVEPGYAVTSSGVLIGEVATVTAGRARVILVNDPQFRVIAETNRSTKGLISSTYQQVLITDVEAAQPLRAGDTVTALSSQYSNARNIPIGVVDEVVESEGLLKQALLIQLVELDNLARVSIP